MIIAIIIAVLLAFLAFMVYASYSISSGIYLKAFCRKSTKERIVALTFDDGPDSAQTPQVLDVLKTYDIRATFFCIGSQLSGNEALIRRMLKEGHTLGNHSYTHTWRWPFYSKRAMILDMKLCQQELERVAQQRINLFRPPFGVTNPTIGQAVRKLGYRTIGWNIRSLDTKHPTDHEKVVRRIRKRLRPGSIILLHDRLPESDVLLKLVLDELDRMEYRVVDLEGMME